MPKFYAGVNHALATIKRAHMPHVKTTKGHTCTVATIPAIQTLHYNNVLPFPGSFPVEQAQIGKLDLIYCRYINCRSYCLGMIYQSYHDITLGKNWKFMLWQCLPFYEFAKFNGMDFARIHGFA